MHKICNHICWCFDDLETSIWPVRWSVNLLFRYPEPKEVSSGSQGEKNKNHFSKRVNRNGADQFIVHWVIKYTIIQKIFGPEENYLIRRTLRRIVFAWAIGKPLKTADCRASKQGRINDNFVVEPHFEKKTIILGSPKDTVTKLNYFILKQRWPLG